jgi:hypothetical protein
VCLLVKVVNFIENIQFPLVVFNLPLSK